MPGRTRAGNQAKPGSPVFKQPMPEDALPDVAYDEPMVETPMEEGWNMSPAERARRQALGPEGVAKEMEADRLAAQQAEQERLAAIGETPATTPGRQLASGGAPSPLAKLNAVGQAVNARQRAARAPQAEPEIDLRAITAQGLTMPANAPNPRPRGR